MINVNDSNFHEEVLSYAHPVIVDFYASWCGPCIPLGRKLEALSLLNTSPIKVVKANIEEAVETAIAYKVLSVPTLIIFINGEESYRTYTIAPGIDSIEGLING